jgi:uncharacterized protein (TIGR02466 family)
VHIEPLFSNFLAIEDSLGLDNDIIESYCRNNLKQYPSPYGINQSYIFNKSFGLDYITDDIKPLIDIVSNKMDILHKHLGFSDLYHQDLCEAWINLNQCKNTSDPHYHVGKFFSAVYYVKSNPTSGLLNFLSSDIAKQYAIDHFRHPNAISNWNMYNMTHQWVYPKAGLLVIFPSWVNHYVSSGSGDDRISIAFNSVLIQK